MEVILLAAAPFVVNFVTQQVKRLKTIELSGSRVALIRTLAVVFSFLATVLGGWASGEVLDPQVTTTFVETVLVFAGSQLTYYLYPKKKV